MLLTPIDDRDTPAFYRLISDWNVVRYMLIPLCRREDEAREFIRNADSVQDGIRWMTRAIRESADGGLLGVCGLGISSAREEAEVWYLVGPRDWGRGLATAATRELLALAFGELALHRVWATCLPENPASARVLEKAGFRREGLLRKSLRIQGEWRDGWLYAILAEEFGAQLPATAPLL